MAQLTRSYQFANAANQTSLGADSCTGSPLSKILQITTSLILLICSLNGNVLVVAVFYRNRTLRTAVHYFIANMAISDLMIPVVYLPLKISNAYNDGLWFVDGVIGVFLCKSVHVVWSLSVFVSVFSMVTIAADRFSGILSPMKPALFSRNNFRLLTVIIAAIWITSFAIVAPSFCASRLVKHETKLYCLSSFQWLLASHRWSVIKITWMITFCLTFLSAMVLTVLYSSIVIFLYRQKNNLHFTTEILRKRAKRNRQITFMLLTIVIIVYAVLIPLYVMDFLFLLKSGVRLPCVLSWIGYSFIPCIYSVVNPIVYLVFNEQYCQGFKEILCLSWPCSHRCNDCLQPVPPLEQDNFHNIGQVNNAPENIELNEQ